jgi:hypothetical protein
MALAAAATIWLADLLAIPFDPLEPDDLPEVPPHPATNTPAATAMIIILRSLMTISDWYAPSRLCPAKRARPALD